MDVPLVINTSPISVVSPRGLLIQEACDWIGTPYVFGGDSEDCIDCSHFVYQVYHKIIPTFSYLWATQYLTSPRFKQVPEPAIADVIYWAPPAGDSSGHVAIVVDPVACTFIGAQTSTGVAIASYTGNGYWAGRLSRRYFRCKELVL